MYEYLTKMNDEFSELQNRLEISTRVGIPAARINTFNALQRRHFRIFMHHLHMYLVYSKINL